MKMAASQSPAQRSRVLGALIQHPPSEESSYHSRLPCPRSVLCAQLARGGAPLSVARSPVWSPPTSRFLLRALAPLLPEEEGGGVSGAEGSPLEVRQPYMDYMSQFL